ncbi:MAG TPA: PEP-CTERM sorting domain-containing protein [Bryobacteraceae bacterium]
MFEKSLSLAVGVILLASTAFGTTLVPGDTVNADVVSAAGWTLLADTGQLNATAATFTGVGESWVYSDSVTGGLDFVYQFKNNGTSTDPAERITASSFAGWTVNAGYVLGLDNPPNLISLSANGAVVGFEFTPGSFNVLPGETTDLLVVETNATDYKSGQFSIQDGSTATLDAFEPSTLAPEPASLALLGAGLLGFSLLRRRSNKN